MNDLAYMIMLIFPYQMKPKVVFVVFALKHLAKTKRNVCHAALIQKTLMEIMILTTVHHHAIPMKNQQCRLESPVWLTHALMKLWMK